MVYREEWVDLVKSMKGIYPTFGDGFPHSDAQQEEIERKHGIPYGNYCLLASYAGPWADTLNSNLRRQNQDECSSPIKKYAHLLNVALGELTPYIRKECYRWPNIDEKGLDYLKNYVGKKVIVPQFWSSSKSTRRPEKKRYFKILTSNSSKGRYIGHIGHDKEEEVLFQSHTCFNILEYTPHFILLEEIQRTRKFDLSLDDYFWNRFSRSISTKKSLTFDEVLQQYEDGEIDFDEYEALLRDLL